MSSTSQIEQRRPWITKILTTDFCPSMNRYVYWLKEPVGWFALAALTSLLAGLYVNPIGFPLFASISIVTTIGIAWPWIATHAVTCEFHPQISALHEGETTEAIFQVKNRLPFPICGMALEGFLDSVNQPESTPPTTSLAWIPPLCTVEYPIELKPEFRGRYPQVIPQIACSFPFGIWTARKQIATCSSLKVWPQVFPISGIVPLSGKRRGDSGEGHRSGGSTEPIGCRPYRIGDSPRHIHWRLSARNETLIVVDRGAPEKPVIEVSINLTSSASICQKGPAAVRNQIAWKTRIAASILTNLTSTRTAYVLTLCGTNTKIQTRPNSQLDFLEQLANVPELGEVVTEMRQTETRDLSTPYPLTPDPSRAWSLCPKLEITGHAEKPQVIIVRFHESPLQTRQYGTIRSIEVNCGHQLDQTLSRLWLGGDHVAIPA